jgi:hypothetical protein
LLIAVAEQIQQLYKQADTQIGFPPTELNYAYQSRSHRGKNVFKLKFFLDIS